MTIDVRGIDRPALFAALYNAARTQGMGFIHHKDKQMTRDEAADILGKSDSNYTDYFRGRVMKINIMQDDLTTVLYDRDNGRGAANHAVYIARGYQP